MAGLFDEGGGGGGSSGGAGIGGLLKGKTFGLPTPLVIVAGILFVWWYLDKKKSTATTAATTASAAAPGSTGSLTPQQYAAEYEANTPTGAASAAWFPGSANESPYGGSVATTTGVAGPPTLSTISPQSGPATGGGTAIISGTNFTGTTAVSFNGVPASFSVSNTGTIFCTIPPDQNASGGDTVQITVVNSQGSVTGLNFAYAKTATTTAATPSPTPTTAPPTTPYEGEKPEGGGYYTASQKVVGRTGRTFLYVNTPQELAQIPPTKVYVQPVPGEFVLASSVPAADRPTTGQTPVWVLAT